MRISPKIIVFLCLVTFFLGCSNDTPKENFCEDIICDRGVCDSDTGECANAGSCLADDQCLDGWLCFDDACSPTTPCAADVPCGRGVCIEGACVNAERCEALEECVDGFRCTPLKQCVEDPCADVDCVRGACNPDTKTCVNSGVCTERTQERDCLGGYYCYGQVCELGETICDDVDCARGICDPLNQECVQPASCEADRDCLAAHYCSDSECVANRCDADDTNCPRGVCNPGSGVCENPGSCGEVGDCLDGWSCVEGRCVGAGQECGDPGCPGTQVCVYIPADLVAVCDEGTQCFSAVDCTQSRVCNDGVCGAGQPCVADAFEPNNDSASAVAIAALDGNIARGSICLGDVDVFAFHTDDSPLFRGLLVVDLTIAAAAVGAGTLALEVEGPDGAIASATTDAAGGAKIVINVGVLDLGAYEIRVSDEPGLFVSGVGYELYADLLDQAAVDACANPTPLDDMTISDNSKSGGSYLLGSSCTSADNAAGENIYSFDVAEVSWVRIETQPASGVDIDTALRRRCEPASELQCANNAAAGQPEVIATALPPGSYFVVVQGADPTAGGDYDITLTMEPLVCGRQDATCVDDMTSRFCNGQGTGFEESPCDNGCDDATGRCSRLESDVCFTAVDASNGLNVSIDWDTLTNDYDPGAGGCVPNISGTQTAGPDAAYYIELPPDHVVQAVQSLGSGDRGSLYLVRDCGNLDSCVAAANATTGAFEELIYFNTSGVTETLYLISDTEADAFGYNLATISIDVNPTVCVPGSTQCASSTLLETCQPLGTDYDQVYCSFGCVAGACEPVTNSVCSGAVDLLTSGSVTGRIDEYSSSYSPNFSGCTNRSAGGADAVFSVTPAAGEVALVSVTADFDVALWVTTDCANASSSCVVGSDGRNQNDESVEFVGDGSTTYFVIVDSQSSATGIFTVSATTQVPTCNPGDALQCLSGTTLEYCTPLGIEAPYACQTTCTNGACDSPFGQICADPIVLTDGQSYTGTMDVQNAINPGGGQVGGCNFPSGDEAEGSDFIFAVDLLAGEWLFADYDMNTSFGIMYVMSDCTDGNSCLTNSPEGGIGSLAVEATTDQRVYLVLDRTTASVSALTFTVNVDIRRQDCAIGSLPYCTDAQTVQYCDSNGFSRDYVCSGSCVAGACDMPRGDECIDPIIVQNGDTVTGNWSTGTNSVHPVAPLDGWCEFDDFGDPEGDEDIYRIDLQPGEFLRATLTTNYGSAMHYIMEDCFDTSTCRDNNFSRGSGVAEFYSTSGGPVYVVVDATSTFNSSTAYTLNFDVSLGALCAPSKSSCVGGTLSLCDAGGSSIQTTALCGAGCANDEYCALEPAADLCGTAPQTLGTSVYTSWDTLTNDVAIASSGCTGSSGGGNDLVYAVNAGPGDVIHAQVQSWGQETVQVYIAEDCADPDSTCLEGQRGGTSNLAEVFLAPQTFGTYFVVAEAISISSDEPFSFAVEVVTQQCVPGQYQCAASAGAMLVCNSVGLWETYDCTGGCMNDTCGTPVGQACFDPVPLTAGQAVSGVFDQPDSVNPGTGQVGACDFGTDQGSGSDTIYTVDLLAGDILDINYTSGSSYGMVYLLSDCLDTDSCLANTPDGTGGSLQYAASVDETVFVVMDRSLSGSSTLNFSIDIAVLTPNCTPGSPASCADANTLQFCDSVGFLQQYPCGGATGTCSAGACDTPTADVCLDAGVLMDGSSIVGDFIGTDDSSPGEGTYGACTFGAGDAPDGVDHFYRVDLSAGDWLIADYSTTTTSAIMYLLGTCGTTGSCLDATSEGADGRIAYRATASESVYLVMDRTTSGSSAIAWNADVIVSQPSCTPGAMQCADGTTLEWCNAYGLYEDWACATTCTAGACDAPSGQICADAEILTHGASVSENFDGTNATDWGSGVVAMCDFGTAGQPGTDHFYRVDLLAGETLLADYTSTSSYALVYFASDCLDSLSCLGNTSPGTGGQLSYTASTNESIFVVVDRGLSGATSSLGYTLDITIQ